MSDKLTAILGEACYGSPWVCTSIHVSFGSTPICWGFQNMVCVWLTENESSRISVFSKFSAPTIAFLAFWLAKKAWLVGVLRHMENSAPSLKTFHFVKIVEIKIGDKTRFQNLLKQLFHSPLWIWSDYNQLALRACWLFYPFISNSGSWNNCYIARFLITILARVFYHYFSKSFSPRVFS